MDMLFPLTVEPQDIPKIPGLSYLPNYVTSEEARDLVTAIDSESWDVSWERRRQPYGDSYGKAKGERAAIPAWGVSLAERMAREHICDRQFDQILVNEYLSGQGIAMHRDYEPFDRTVVSLSLLAPCVMQFRHVASGRSEQLLLEARSLIVLSDEVRYDWEHGIARRKSDIWHGLKVPRARRLSVTFRLLKK